MSRPGVPSPEVRRLRDLIRSFLADYLWIVERDCMLEVLPGSIVLRRRSVDRASVVAEAASRKGERMVILVRIEPEVLPASEVEARLRRSLRSLRLPYGEPVLASVVYLRGGYSGVRLHSGVLARACGTELARIYFTTFALGATRAEGYLERSEPLAWALAAWMRPTKRAPDEHRRACLERIATAPLDEERRALLRRGQPAYGKALRISV